jgi:hypothetical protein
MFLASLFWSKEDMLSVIDCLTFDAVKGFVHQVSVLNNFFDILAPI